MSYPGLPEIPIHVLYQTILQTKQPAQDLRARTEESSGPLVVHLVGQSLVVHLAVKLLVAHSLAVQLVVQSLVVQFLVTNSLVIHRVVQTLVAHLAVQTLVVHLVVQTLVAQALPNHWWSILWRANSWWSISTASGGLSETGVQRLKVGRIL